VLPRTNAAVRADLALQAERRPTVVAGPLCESGDVFTQDAGGVVETRALAPAEVGDLLVFHDTGAYGASMSSNYNTRPLAAEVLVDGARDPPAPDGGGVDRVGGVSMCCGFSRPPLISNIQFEDRLKTD
jgi:hypothetical protein